MLSNVKVKTSDRTYFKKIKFVSIQASKTAAE